MPKSDQERISELEARVKALETEGKLFKEQVGERLLREIGILFEAMGLDASDDAPEIQIAAQLEGLGLPEVEKRERRDRRGK